MISFDIFTRDCERFSFNGEFRDSGPCARMSQNHPKNWLYRMNFATLSFFLYEEPLQVLNDLLDGASPHWLSIDLDAQNPEQATTLSMHHSRGKCALPQSLG